MSLNCVFEYMKFGHETHLHLFKVYHYLPNEPSILSKISAVSFDISRLPVVDVIVPFNVGHFSNVNSPSSLVISAKPLSYKSDL